jgi:deazaflavin-dependent oxidoreductase (nitroreductase family)
VDADALAALDHCYVTTKGRRSGSPHTIEIWFALHDDVVYLLAGGSEESDWVKNLRADPTVGLRLGDRDLICQGRLVDDPEEDALARRLLLDKYGPRDPDDLTTWARTALAVAIDLPFTELRRA